MSRVKKIKESLTDILVDIIILVISGGVFSYIISNGYEETAFMNFLMSFLACMVVIPLIFILYRIIRIIILSIGLLIFKK